jgi:CspA family cold shock protein
MRVEGPSMSQAYDGNNPVPNLRPLDATFADDRVISALVRWYDPVIGFGFVIMPSQRADAFLHCTVVKQANLAALEQGDRLECVIETSERGFQVTKILVSAVTENSTLHSRGSQRSHMTGRVKFYDTVRGFGFIRVDTGDEVFVGAKLLKNLGLTPLREDQAVKITARAGAKGLVVETLTFLPAEPLSS